jgi:ketosteroid isomerase-like protein
MEKKQSAEKIRQVAMDFDNAIENGNFEQALSAFAHDCEIELLGVKLTGLEGARRWMNWLFEKVASIRFQPITIMVDGDTFFEEFVATAKLDDGREIHSKQAEVLIYEDYKLKSLRLYFDRLDFSDAVARDFISKAIVKQLIKMSLKGLT